MARFVLLIRGVNVGKGNRVPMAELRTALEELGHTSVRTILNSGNAVFDSASRSPTQLAADIAVAIQAAGVVKSWREDSACHSRTPKPSHSF